MNLVYFESEEVPDAGYDQALAVLRRFTTQTVGAPDNRPYAITLRRPHAPEILGGLWAQSRWGGFHLDMLVVPDGARGQGIGTRLMATAEAEARRRECDHMWLDTYAFQARGFYERLGFEVFGRLEGSAPIYPRYFMQKRLA